MTLVIANTRLQISSVLENVNEEIVNAVKDVSKQSSDYQYLVFITL